MDDLTQTELASMRGRVESITVDEIRGALRPYRVHPKEFDAWLAAHDREVAAKALDLTPAELLHLAADLQQDMRAKIGPRLTGAQKVIDAAQAIIRSSTPSTGYQTGDSE